MAVSAGRVAVEADVTLGGEARRVLALGLAVQAMEGHQHSTGTVIAYAKEFEKYLKGDSK